MATKIPAVGEAFEVSELKGYVMEQNRPLTCRGWRPSKKNPGQYTGSCEGECGGNCNGTTTRYQGFVEERIFWADNSIDIMVRCEDGELRRTQLVAPRGDVCF